MTATSPGELGWNDPNAINLELTICAFNFPVKSSFNYTGLWAFKHMCKVTILGNQSGTWGPKIKTRMCDLVLLEMLSMNPRLHKNYKDKISPPMTLQI